ncbi:MAG: MgtC/SapB family protein [Gemmatimonadaceae bacterium]
MPIFPETLDTAARLAVAALVGLAVGIERQRSGRTDGPDQDFAGPRTFLLIGLLGGLGGLFVTNDAQLTGAALVAAGALLAVGAYVMTARRNTEHAIDGTTEAAALIVLALGVMAGGGALKFAAGIAAIVVLALAEKHRLHGWVDRVDPVEMRAALHFAVLALVVLPILPTTIPTPLGDLTPRATWMFVLIISALNFGGHLARRVVGRERGYAVTGALGGLVSSTAVTWGFARSSRDEETLRAAYAAGVVAACTVLIPRVAVVTLALNRDVGIAMLPYLAAPFVAGVAFTWWTARSPSVSQTSVDETPRSPLRLGAALQMAFAFQVVLLLMGFVRTQFGDAGVYTTAALFGTTDVDAITVAMTRMDQGGFATVAARAIIVAVASNTLVKLLIAAGIGRGAFRLRVALALGVMLVALVASLLLLR